MKVQRCQKLTGRQTIKKGKHVPLRMKFLDLFYRSLFILLILLRNNYYNLKQVDEERTGQLWEIQYSEKLFIFYV